MSLYVDIYNDFPLRCARVWEAFRGQAQTQGMDVTLMLMAAAAGFATPWEHLKVQLGHAAEQSDHPAFHQHDERAYESSLKAVGLALGQPALTGSLFAGAHAEAWLYGRVSSIGRIKDLVEAGGAGRVPISTLKSRDLARVLRNALAHNNIYAFAGPGRDEIAALTFFAEAIDRRTKEISHYDVLSVTVAELQVFLDNWFRLLKTSVRLKGAPLKLVIAEALEDGGGRLAA